MLQLNYKKRKNIAPFSTLLYTPRCKGELCNFTKALPGGGGLAKGMVGSLLNGCEKEDRNGGKDCKAQKSRGGMVRSTGAVRFIIMRRKTTKNKILKGGN